MNRPPLTRFLLALAGTNLRVLDKAPGDTPKQISLAGVILTTAGLAVLSSAFALRTALHLPLATALFIGLMWGVAIANLDRWLVAATARQPTLWGNVRLALPRLLLAVVIGTVVSTPLTLEIFRSEIDNELTVMQAEQKAAFTSRLAEDARYRDLPAQREQIVKLQAEAASGVDEAQVYENPAVADLRQQLATVNASLAKAEEAVVCEKEGKCGSGKAGAGPAFNEKVALRDRLRSQSAELQEQLDAKTQQVRAELQQSSTETRANAKARLADLQTRVDQATAAKDAEIERNAAAVRNGDGLLARLHALERISAGDRVLLAAHVFLFLFFTAIECLPVLFKFLLSLGKPSLYEQLFTVEDQSTYADAVRGFRAAHDEQEIDLRTSLEAHETRRRNQLKAEVEAAQMLLDSQKSLASQAIAAWQAREEARLDSDLDSFVTQPTDPTEAGLEDAFQARVQASDSARDGAQVVLASRVPRTAFQPSEARPRGGAST